MSSQGSKAIVLSGGARGIGRVLARTFLQKGHRVFILDIDAEELAYTTEVHLASYADRVSSRICNLRDINDIRSKIAAAAKFFGGRIDVLINNGGIAAPHWKDGKTMEDPATIDEWQAYIETNLTAPFAASQACIPYMKTGSRDEAEKKAENTDDAGPCIIHIGSFRAQQSDPNQEGYASTKAGQIGLMHSMAVSCEPWGIRVNMVMPGRIKVTHECREGDEKGEEWEVEKDDVDSHVTNRAGKGEDIAHAVDYLIHAGFVSGQDIVVDGGALRMKNK